MVRMSIMRREMAVNTLIYSHIYNKMSFLSGTMITVNTMAHFPDLENAMYVISLQLQAVLRQASLCLQIQHQGLSIHLLRVSNMKS